MSKLMWVLGIVLAAVGVALGLMTTYSPGKMQAYGLLPDTAAILFVGGVLSIGLGGVINALRNYSVALPVTKPAIAVVTERMTTEEEATPVKLPVGFGRRAAEATAAAAAGGAILSNTSSSVAQTTSPSVSETIAALDEAKADIKKALGGMDDITGSDEHRPVVTPLPEPAAEIVAPLPAAVEVEVPETDPELYVVEEKIIRGRPARILSDETVEAETDEGWMRFENLEHLNEYIDSTEEPDA
jgi:hypothetical protein